MKNSKYVPFIILLVSICSFAFLYGCGSVAGGGGGGGAATAGSPWIYVGDTLNHRIVVIDGTTNTTVESIELGQDPANIAASPDGNKIYCSMDDGQIYVIDTATNKTVEAFTVASTVADSLGMVVSNNNRFLYLTSVSTAEFFKVDLDSPTHAFTGTMLVGAGNRIALNSANTKAYVCIGDPNTSIEVINLSTMTKEASVDIGNHPYDIVIKDNYAYIAMHSAMELIARMDLNSCSVETIDDFTPSDAIAGVASIPGQDKLYFTNYISAGEIRILKPSKWPTLESTIITSSELVYPERIAATANYAYVVDTATPHDKIAIIDVSTDLIVKYIYGLTAEVQSSNPVVVYK